jgi:UDP-glucose 4-epimerase
MRVAVTGGRGFIGSACVRLLETLGHEPFVIDRAQITGPDSYADDVRKLATKTLTDARVDAVIHLAGVLGTAELYETPDLAVDVNVKGALRVLEACRDSGAAYVGITMPDVWANLYQATKIAAQRMALAFHRDFGVPVTHVRAFNAYGPGQKYGPGHPQKIIPTFATKAYAGEPLPVWGSGEQTVDLVHVDFVAECLVDAALGSRKEPKYGHGEVWDAGSGYEVSVLDVARMVCNMAEQPCRVEFLPMRDGETPGTKLCATEPGPCGLAQSFVGLGDTVDAYRP